MLHLLALMLLTESRRAARTGRDGGLADQDRTLWDSALIAGGRAIVRRCLRATGRAVPDPGRDQRGARRRGGCRGTGWHQIVAPYDQRTVFSPTPVVALNRTVAVAGVDGPAAALAIVDDLDLGHYDLDHAMRAGLPHRHRPHPERGRTRVPSPVAGPPAASRSLAARGAASGHTQPPGRPP